ncbi:MAG: tetratricopeptide repeat protein [Planctomycetes bacterium]|nr:tetratricopeptide repeat protein [Planctomycetota bacterium]
MSAALLSILLLFVPDGPAWTGWAAEGAWQQIEEAAHARLAVAPDDGEALYWLGRSEAAQIDGLGSGTFAASMGQRLLDSAAEHFARASDLASPRQAEACEWGGLLAWGHGLPVDPAAFEAHYAESHWPGAAYVRGLLALDAGAFEEAALWLGRAAEGAPGRGDVQLALADALSALGRRDEALAAWDAAVDGRFDALVARDSLLDVLERLLPGPSAAPQRLERLDRLRSRPEWTDDAWLAWHRAFALEQLDRKADALAAFDEGRKGRTAVIDRAHARALSLNDRPLEAADLLEPLARERDWDAYGDLVSVADRLGQQRRFDEAVAIYDRALAIEPRDERAQRNRALTLWRSGRDALAAEAWEALIEHFPGRADLLNDAALAAEARGDRARARALLTEAIGLPGSIDAHENLARLLLEGDPDATERAQARALAEDVLVQEPARARSLLLRLLARDASL